MTDTDSFSDLLAANECYQASFESTGLSGKAAKGLAVVTCIDSRLDPLAMLGLVPGDAKILRTAGARMTDDVLRSLALATNLLDVRRVAVVQHTDCAMAREPDESLRTKIAEATGVDASGFEPLAMSDQQRALATDIELVRSYPLVGGDVVIRGFLYDVETGALHPQDV
jgi:carbonic anhydrase